MPGDDENQVWINFPRGSQQPLDALVRQMIEKSLQTDLPVGLGGHTILCDLFDVEVGPDCYSCKYGVFSGCEIKQPQTPDKFSSAIYNQRGNYCPRYFRRDGIRCTCDEEGI